MEKFNKKEWQAEKDAKQARLKRLFPKRQDRWEFDDLYCNRGGSVSVRMPEMPTIRIKDFGADTLIEVLFHKMFKGDLSHKDWEKLMKGIKPLYREHKKSWKEASEACEIPDNYFDNKEAI